MTSFTYPDRTFIIAELSANHGHALENALATVRAAAACGADAIKIQTYTADTMTLDCDTAPFQIKGGTLWDGTTLHKLYQEAFTPWDWHAPLAEEARKHGLVFFSSPFDKTAVDLLVELDAPIMKIASFEIEDIPLIEYAASKGRAMIISTGIAGLSQIEEAVAACRRFGNDDITLLKCTSAYPAEPSEANLMTIPNLKATFGTRVGLSDHTMSDAVPIAAVALGATVIEKHFIVDRAIGGPDASFSLTPDQFKSMVDGVRVAEQALGGVTYEMSEKSRSNRAFGRSIFVAQDIKAGDVLTEENLRVIRPGDGLHPRHYKDLLGRPIGRDAAKGTPFEWSLMG